MDTWTFSETEQLGQRSLPDAPLSVLVREVLPQAWTSQELRRWCETIALRMDGFEGEQPTELRKQIDELSNVAIESGTFAQQQKQKIAELEAKIAILGPWVAKLAEFISRAKDEMTAPGTDDRDEAQRFGAIVQDLSNLLP